MKIPHLVLCKLTDHVAPRFPGDIVWAVTFLSNQILHHASFHLAVLDILQFVQIFFIINYFISLKSSHKVAENPWHATTLEWAAPSPPPHGNFLTEPVAYREPYEYSVPGQANDYSPQFVAEG